jgi:hypothetical protein
MWNAILRNIIYLVLPNFNTENTGPTNSISRTIKMWAVSAVPTV